MRVHRYPPQPEAAGAERVSVRSSRRSGSVGALARIGWGVFCALILAPHARALNPLRPANSYSVYEWSVDRGLPSDKIRAVTQTKDGYLWIATAHGISRFDGVRFTNFTGATNPELRGGGFFGIVEAPDGSLWAGGDNGLFRWNKGKFERFTKRDGLANDYVRALALTRDGAVVACTRTGYSFVRNGRITTPGGEWNEVAGVTRAYLDCADGTQLLGTDDGLWRVTGEKVERISETNGLPARGYLALLQTADGSVWIGHSAGVRRIRKDGSVEDIGPAQGLTSPRVSALQFDRDGNLWIASTGGFYRYANGRVEPASYPNASTVLGMFEDREGALWIAAAPGLFRIEDNVATSVGTAAGLAQTSVYAVCETSDGAWWIGLWNGGIYRYEQGKARRWSPAPVRPEQVLSVAESPNGTLWVGTNAGLLRRTADGAENFYQPRQADQWLQTLKTQPDAVLPGIAHPRVNSLAPDAAGGMWVGTDGALYHSENGGFRVYTTADGLPGNVIKGVLRAQNGDVWVTAPPAGVARLHDGQWTSWRCGQQISSMYPRALYEDTRGAVWVTTDGGGVNRFDGRAWRIFSSLDGLADDFIASLVEDADANLWLAFPRGVMRISRAELDAFEANKVPVLRPHVFGRSDGLPAGEPNQQGSPSSWRTRDGRLLFATDRGVAVIEPRQLSTQVVEPPVYIERMVVNGVDADVNGRITIPPGSNDVEFHYTAVETLAPEKLRFRIKLAPLDSDWVEAGDRRDIRYAKLPPGDYTFSVMATNTAGGWARTWPTIEFKVHPFFYQRTSFLVGTACFVALLVGLAFWARSRLARRRLAILSKLVDERTRELRDATRAAEAAVIAKNEFIAALKQAQEETARQQARFKFIFDVVPIGFSSMIQGAPSTRIVNPAYAQITGVPIERCREGRVFIEATHPDDRAATELMNRRLMAGEIDSYTLEKRYIHADGSMRWAVLTAHLYRDESIGQSQEIRTLVDVTARKEAEAKLAETNRQLLETSRQAGMAEVATGVLHNVGNVLNSVNVSATMLTNLARQSKIDRVAKVSDLLEENAAKLPEFIAADPRGQRLPAFLRALAEHLAREQADLLAEIESLQKNIEHIKEVVAMQQTYARVSGVIEQVAITELIETALRINTATLQRHRVHIVRDYVARPTIATEKHRVIQILVNLIQNAKHACKEAGQDAPEMVIRIVASDGRVAVSVTDNGIGIAPENLTRIFAHGFTTRKNGHGFGLHSGALAARELGGSLMARSEGVGRGATFILELPEVPPGKLGG